MNLCEKEGSSKGRYMNRIGLQKRSLALLEQVQEIEAKETQQLQKWLETVDNF